MWFLIRTGAWLSLVLLALPLGSPDGNGERIGLAEAVIAASSAAADMGNFCERRAETCVTGRKLAGEVTQRAKAAARLASNYLDTDKPEADTTIEEIIETGSVKKPAK